MTKEVRLRQLVRADPAMAINKLNQILRQEFGSGIRKTVALDIKADELGKIRKPKAERVQKFTPVKYLQPKILLIKISSTLQIEDEIVNEIENLYQENSKKTKKELFKEIHSAPKKKAIYIEIHFEIFDTEEDAIAALSLEEAGENFISGKILPVSQEKKILQIIAAVIEISENEVNDWENEIRTASASIKNKKFQGFVKELAY